MCTQNSVSSRSSALPPFLHLCAGLVVDSMLKLRPLVPWPDWLTSGTFEQP